MGAPRWLILDGDRALSGVRGQTRIRQHVRDLPVDPTHVVANTEPASVSFDAADALVLGDPE
jgi:hypothetical protein